MFGLFVILFLAIPVVEIYLIVAVGGVLGGWNTIGLMILISVVGAWMVRREGLSIISKLQRQLGEGSMPAKELVDGLLVALAGALMLTPGFLTDGIGLLLLVPPTRAIIRTILIARFRNRVTIGGGPAGGQIYDVGEARIHDYDDERGEPPNELDS